jgi:hypothetical protein
MSEQNQPEPTEDYTDFEGCVRWHGQVTIASTATEICALEFALGGDTVDVPMDEPPERSNP